MRQDLSTMVLPQKLGTSPPLSQIYKILRHCLLLALLCHPPQVSVEVLEKLKAEGRVNSTCCRYNTPVMGQRALCQIWRTCSLEMCWNFQVRNILMRQIS